MPRTIGSTPPIPPILSRSRSSSRRRSGRRTSSAPWPKGARPTWRTTSEGPPRRWWRRGARQAPACCSRCSRWWTTWRGRSPHVPESAVAPGWLDGLKLGPAQPVEPAGLGGRDGDRGSGPTLRAVGARGRALRGDAGQRRGNGGKSYTRGLQAPRQGAPPGAGRRREGARTGAGNRQQTGGVRDAQDSRDRPGNDQLVHGRSGGRGASGPRERGGRPHDAVRGGGQSAQRRALRGHDGQAPGGDEPGEHRLLGQTPDGDGATRTRRSNATSSSFRTRCPRTPTATPTSPWRTRATRRPRCRRWCCRS